MKVFWGTIYFCCRCWFANFCNSAYNRRKRVRGFRAHFKKFFKITDFLFDSSSVFSPSIFTLCEWFESNLSTYPRQSFSTSCFFLFFAPPPSFNNLWLFSQLSKKGAWSFARCSWNRLLLHSLDSILSSQPFSLLGGTMTWLFLRSRISVSWLWLYRVNIKLESQSKYFVSNFIKVAIIEFCKIFIWSIKLSCNFSVLTAVKAYLHHLSKPKYV